MDLNHHTGASIVGWPHVVQSIETILATRLRTRCWLREFGSEVAQLVDAPMNDAGVMALYVAVAEALDRWEPRFQLADVGIEGSADGVITLRLVGSYLPNAHKGDFGTVEDGERVVRFVNDRVDSWRADA